MRIKRSRAWTCIVVLLLFEAFIATVGRYGMNALIGRGGSFWVPLEATESEVPASMMDSLSEKPKPLGEGVLKWRNLEAGLDVADLSVLSLDEKGERNEVDSILLTRIDPARFRFEVHLDSSGSRGLADWMSERRESVMIINGSYFGKSGEPITPVMSLGMAYGPKVYKAEHGAFLSRDGSTHIVDLKRKTWNDSLFHSENALVSYPLLVDESGVSRSKGNPRWLANRSFVGEDREGRMVFGTTKGGTFSLSRLSEFLIASSLQMRIALNLDGGPVACQGIQHPTFHRDVCGTWETRTEEGRVEVLKSGIPNRRWALPIVIAAVRK